MSRADLAEAAARAGRRREARTLPDRALPQLSAAGAGAASGAAGAAVGPRLAQLIARARHQLARADRPLRRGSRRGP